MGRETRVGALAMMVDMRSIWWTVGAVVVVAAGSACGPTSPDADESATGDGPAGETTRLPEDGTAEASTGGDVSSGDSTSGDLLPVCAPGNFLGSNVWFDDGGGAEVDLHVPCTLTDIQSGLDAEVWLFSCEGGSYSIGRSNVPSPGLEVGDEVTLRAFVAQPFWTNEYMMLVQDGVVVFAAGDGDGVPGDGSSQHGPDDFFGALGVEIISDVCAPERSPDDCALARREALTFTDAGVATVVYDQNVVEGEVLRIGVDTAASYTVWECFDVPESWYEFWVVRM